MSPLVVLGAGGHGKVVADILRAAGQDVLGFVDDSRAQGSLVLGLPVLGPTDMLRERPYRVALGLGDNAVRARLAERVVELGCTLATAIHPRAVVAPSARIGDGAAVMALAVVNPDAVIERGAIVNTGVIVEHDCVLGAFSHVSPNAVLAGGCTVGDLAHVGVGASMLPRTSVGARSIVGGGAVVARDIPADVVAMGIPARVTRTVTKR